MRSIRSLRRSDPPESKGLPKDSIATGLPELFKLFAISQEVVPYSALQTQYNIVRPYELLHKLVLCVLDRGYQIT